MAFSDAFNPANIEKLMADPRVQLGLQMMAAGGPIPGNPSTGQRLAMAGQGFMDQRHQQQLLDARQMQMQQQAMQQQAMQQLAANMKNPEFLANLTPHARRLAESGASADQVFGIWETESRLAQARQQAEALQQYRADTLAQKQPYYDARTAAAGRSNQGGGAPAQKVPTPRQIIEEPLPDGRVQKHIFDAATGGYRPYGAPYARSAAGGSDPLSALLGEIPTGQPGLTSNAQPSQQVAPPPAGMQADSNGMVYQGDVPMPHLAQQPQQPAPIVAGGAVKGQTNQQGPARPTTQAEFDALPKGALYVDPDDGRTYRK